MEDYNLILEDLLDGHSIVNRGHLKYIVSGKAEWISPYGPRPIFEIDMDSPDKKVWVSYLQIWSLFQDKYNLNNDQIKDIIKTFLKTKLPYDITL